MLLTSEAAAQVEARANPIHGRVLKLFRRLENLPEVSGAKSLRGDLAGRYRMRTGDYRIQFQVAGGLVTVETIGHRDGFYEE